MDYTAEINTLPIAPYLDLLCETLKSSPSRSLVLTAQTAAGKSTAVPIALLKHFTGKIVMLEPRRIAAIATASRVAELLGEEAGETAGYIMHMERRVSKKTRFIVMTEGVFIRMLQDDPSLEGADVVVLDEAHERSIDADLALAFLKETTILRDDIFVMVMSATMQTKSLSEYMGRKEYPNGDINGFPEQETNGIKKENTKALSGFASAAQDEVKKYYSAPVLDIPGKQYPVETVYRPIESSIKKAGNILQNGFTGNKLINNNSYIFFNAVTDAIIDEYPNLSGGEAMLVFLPGIWEIKQVQNTLSKRFSDNAASAKIMLLHSSIPIDEQKQILLPSEKTSPPRIILSSAIAETSLTVPGVKIVIDSGLARINRMNVSSGMSSLSTEIESAFSAEQRRGRAGRTGPGQCVRLWAEHEKRVEKADPEISRGDIIPLVLECSIWCGVCDKNKLQWLTAPSDGAWLIARGALLMMGLLCEDGGRCRITNKGKAASQLGVHPRLACVALAGFGTDEKTTKDAISCAIDYSDYAAVAPHIRKRAEEDLMRRLKSLHGYKPKTATDKTLSASYSADNQNDVASLSPSRAVFLLAGFPDRLGKLENDGTTYRFPSGRTASINASGIKGGQCSVSPQWIVAPIVDAGERMGRIKDWEEVSEKEVSSFLALHTKKITEVHFEEGTYKLKKTVISCYGKIILSKRDEKSSKTEYIDYVCAAVKENGLDWLPLGDDAKDLIIRAKFCTIHGCNNIPQEKTLQNTPEQWLSPFITEMKLTKMAVLDALRYCMNDALINRLAPRNLTLTNGAHCKILYETIGDGIRPVAEMIIQRLFGVLETPRIMGAPVTFRLLSPARRPVQITDDLNRFWRETWQEVAKEMRARYPKHDWSYAPK